jgi:hypothetical protein
METNGHHHGFNIRTLYYDEPTPKLMDGHTTESILWNVITLYYHEYTDVLEEMKKNFASTSHFMAPYFNSCYVFVLNEMSKFCNEHPVPDSRPWKSGEKMLLPIDEYPIWFGNLESYLADLTWGGKDKKIMTKEVLPKLLNAFVSYEDIISETDFSVKDNGEVEAIINRVIESNPDIVESYKKGKVALLNRLFGEVMKASGGKIDVVSAKEMLEIRLNS